MPTSNRVQPDTTSSHEMTVLYEAAKALGGTLDLRQALYAVLDILNREMGMVRGTINILDPQEDVVQVEVAHGMSATAASRGKYKLGEGITGRVVKTGEPVIVPHISKEPMFLDRTRSRKKDTGEDLSFLCVPVRSANKVLGAISVDRIFTSQQALESDIRFLTIIASLIARAVVKLEELSRERERLKAENKRLNRALADRYSTTNIVGNSNKMKEVFYLIEQVSKSTATVFIRGESGTGKELVASAIHYNSDRADKPFIKVNCAALPTSLVESELFGHSRGAFTGALKDKPGKFELADHGTIFLDEIGSIPPVVQAKLLRVLQELEVERVGDIKTRKVNVRVIAATNKNLELAMERGEFREDLYYRLNVFPIFLPPLRERPTDILLLADHFIEKYSRLHGKDVRRLAAPAVDALVEHHWPGNVRELENCIERAMLLASEGVIHSYHLPPTLRSEDLGAASEGSGLEEVVAKVERDLISDALKSNHGNISQAAKGLKTTERILRYKIKKYDLNPKSYR